MMKSASPIVDDHKTCPDCAETIKCAAKVCRYCGYRFEAEALPASLDTGDALAAAPEPPSPRADRKRKPKTTIGNQSDALAYWALGISVAAVAVFGGIEFLSDKPTELQASETKAVATGPDQIKTDVVCDMAVKSVLISEKSFDPEPLGAFHAEGPVGVVSKKFESTNGFGAKLTSRYTCKWDSKRDTIVSLEITNPYGETKKLR